MQDRLLREDVLGNEPLIVTELPDPVTGTELPGPEAALALTIWTALDVELVVVDTVNVAVASTPSEMAVVFKPLAMQTYCPEEGELQETVFPAPEAAGPVVTDTLPTSAGTKENVHCMPAACVPFET